MDSNDVPMLTDENLPLGLPAPSQVIQFTDRQFGDLVSECVRAELQRQTQVPATPERSSSSSGGTRTPKNSLVRQLTNREKVDVVNGIVQRAQKDGRTFTAQCVFEAKNPSTYTKMANRMSFMEANPDKKANHPGRTTNLTESLDPKVLEFIKQQRSQSIAVTKSTILKFVHGATCGLLQDDEAENYYKRAYERLALRVLRRTESKPPLSSEACDALGLFCDELATAIAQQSRGDGAEPEVFTVDETGAFTESPDGKTVVLPDEKGRVHICREGNMKNRITVTVCVSKRRKLPPQIIFKGTPGLTDQANSVASDLESIVADAAGLPPAFIMVQKNAWQDAATYAKVVERWLAIMGPGVVYTHDSVSFHTGPTIANKLTEGGAVEVRGPVDQTHHWQAADLGIIAEFKRRLSDLVKSEKGSMGRRRQLEVILEAYYGIPQELCAACIDLPSRRSTRGHDNIINFHLCTLRGVKASPAPY
jgi:hypothetical protein